jgi:hypothetical protein
VADRPTFVIELQPQPGTDTIRTLRAVLKLLWRQFGLKAVNVEIREAERLGAHHDNVMMKHDSPHRAANSRSALGRQESGK